MNSEKRYNFQNTLVPKHWRSVRDCWFLNGTSSKWNIGFLRDELYKEFFVSVFKNHSEIENFNDPSLYGNWDELFVRVFNLEFLIKRKLNGFVIYTKNPKSDSQNEQYSKSIILRKKLVDSTSDVPSNGELKSRNLQISNRVIEISQTESLIETSCCRFAIIYVLAKAYVTKLDNYVRSIADDPNNARKMYEDMQLWKTKFMYVVPLNTNRVVELSFMWEDLYNHFRIDLLVKEMERKLKEITLLEQSKKIDTLNSRMLYLSVVATISAIVSAAISIYDVFIR